MSTDETIDELVDKVINEVLSKSEKESDDLKERKTKPFRYLTDKEEIKAELTTEEKTPFSLMKETTETNVFEDQLAILGLGDVDTIEDVIKKHEASRKFREK